jgi:tryptophanase
MQIRHIALPPYECHFWFIANCSREEYAKWCVNVFGCQSPAAGLASNGRFEIVERGDGHRQYVVWLKTFDWTIPDQAIAVHELFHLVTAVMRDVGVRVDESGEEAAAYLLTYAMQEVWKCMKPRHHKKASRRQSAIDNRQ